MNTSSLRNYYRRAERDFAAGTLPALDTIVQCDTLLLSFETIGYPDWWQDVERLKLDAQLKRTYS